MLRKIFLSIAIALAVVGLMQLRVEWPQQASAVSAGPHWTEKSSSERKAASGSIDIEGLNRAFISLAETTSPAVVNIYTKSRVQVPRSQMMGGLPPDDLFRFFFGNPFGDMPQAPAQREAQSLGSGFVINSGGTIITNSHVVRPTGRNADSVMVKFLSDSQNSEGHPATIIGVDESTDVAVIKLKKIPKDLKFIPLGNSDGVKVGEWVVAIGNPYGHSHSVTKGIISALGRNISEGLPSGTVPQRADFIQTDASINPGNSGGPLINLYGEVVGINTAIDARAQGIGFAIPINTAKSAVRQIIEKGEVQLGWIGVAIDDLNAEVARSLKVPDSDGALIQDVMPEGPAAKAGLRAYDVVREVNGKKITSSRDFIRVIANMNPGENAALKVLRDGRQVELTAKVAKRPSAQELARRSGEDFSQDDEASGNKSVGRTGLALVELTPGLRRRLNAESSLVGVVISAVSPRSPAAIVGLAPGDVITEIDRAKVRNVAEATRALTKKKDTFLLKVQRGAASVILILDLKAAD